MIVKNEEEVLNQCLSSIREVCDEIIIVDTGSTDKTKEIAKLFADKIIDFEWVDDFSAARNFAFSHASMDYILWIDGDDIVLKKDLEKFKTLKRNLNPSIDAVSMIYVVDYDDDGNPTFSFRRNRLVKREKNFKWVGPVHEYLDVGGNIYSSDIVITHRKKDKSSNLIQSDRNLKIYENRLKKGEVFTPRDLFYYANELKDHSKYTDAINYYKKFIDTKKGWVEDEIRACINMANCYRNIGDEEEEKRALVSSIFYDIPRPEVSCRLGDIYKGKSEYKKAIIWYQLALESEASNNNGFALIAYSTWYPHLQLCVCYWKIGEIEKSVEHNNKAKLYRPDDINIQMNDEFFESYFNKE
jgi:glycosyltransferase involved in cell wall biosynthesis